MYVYIYIYIYVYIYIYIHISWTILNNKHAHISGDIDGI